MRLATRSTVVPSGRLTARTCRAAKRERELLCFRAAGVVDHARVRNSERAAEAISRKLFHQGGKVRRKVIPGLYDAAGGRHVAERVEGGSVERFPLEYAFGSGRHAVSFVTLLARDPTRPVAWEHRLTYFAHTQSLGLTPGQSLAGHAPGNSARGRRPPR